MVTTDGHRPTAPTIPAAPSTPVAPSTPTDQVSLRRHNLALVLRQVRDSGPRSRARLATSTGLNKATISSLVAELVDRGLLRDGGTERRGVGRPGQAVELAGTGVCGIGAEVNVDYLAVVALDLGGRVVSERRLAQDTAGLTPDAVLDRLARLVAEVLDDVSADGGEPVGITVAVPGLVEAALGQVALAPNLGWRDVPVVQLVRERLGGWTLPLLIDNEANLAAIAELAVGRSARSGDLLVLFGATGVGGGIVANGQMLCGSRGFAGEVGHISVDPDGLRCGCGRIGCWETVVGLSALMSQVADPDDPVRDPALDLSERMSELRRRAELHDGRTLGALQRLGSWLGTGAALLVNVLNPQVLVLGGYFAALGPWLTPAVEHELARRVVAAGAGGCRVEVSTLGFTAAARGGAEVALGRVVADPTLAHRAGVGGLSQSIGGSS
jgi:predicted NBD/HSP70 family sugar kinase